MQPRLVFRVGASPPQEPSPVRPCRSFPSRPVRPSFAPGKDGALRTPGGPQKGLIGNSRLNRKT